MVTEKLFLEVVLFLCFALQKNDKSENINMRQPLSFFLLFIFMTLGIRRQPSLGNFGFCPEAT